MTNHREQGDYLSEMCLSYQSKCIFVRNNLNITHSLELSGGRVFSGFTGDSFRTGTSVGQRPPGWRS